MVCATPLLSPRDVVPRASLRDGESPDYPEKLIVVFERLLVLVHGILLVYLILLLVSVKMDFIIVPRSTRRFTWSVKEKSTAKQMNLTREPKLTSLISISP